jgi:hypothetical protein
VQQTKPEKETSHDVQHLLQLDGAISTTQGDFADDERPLKRLTHMGQQRRRYARIHRDALFYPLGGIVAELEALPPGPDNGKDSRGCLPPIALGAV